MEKMNIKVAVACSDSAGTPSFFITTVAVTQEEYDDGFHYELAQDDAIEEGFESPFVCFDESEHCNIIDAAQQLAA